LPYHLEYPFQSSLQIRQTILKSTKDGGIYIKLVRLKVLPEASAQFNSLCIYDVVLALLENTADAGLDTYPAGFHSNKHGTSHTAAPLEGISNEGRFYYTEVIRRDWYEGGVHGTPNRVRLSLLVRRLTKAAKVRCSTGLYFE
jgi:hypothetical protein